ncbi:MAG: hypothetical protein XXXJIFNMEKO3_03165 [Candidatus Erwinia impunctatus]|nr:hypothetical protein XXXJIFNMEKO_03165 [Culicoides impunctatus]
MLHLLPGFHNQLIVSRVSVGPESAPFTFYYNLDKALVPFVLFATLPGLLQRPPLAKATAVQWLLLLLAQTRAPFFPRVATPVYAGKLIFCLSG